MGLRGGAPPVPVRPGGGPRVRGPVAGPNTYPLPGPFAPPNPFPPGYPLPGVNPSPGDPFYPEFVKRCWKEWSRSCRVKYPLIPACKGGAKTFKETIDDFANNNVNGGIWPTGARFEFVNCMKVQEFNEPAPSPLLPGPSAPPLPTPSGPGPCGPGVPGYTVHCKVMVFTHTGIWISERDAVSVIMCKCCDDNDPTSGPRIEPSKPHFPGGNRPPNHSIDPVQRPYQK